MVPMRLPCRPVVLVFAGLDPSGGAGLAADILAIAAQGAHALPVITALTVQDNDRVFAVEPVAPELLRRQAQALIDKMAIHAVKIGIPGSAANAAVIAQLIAQLRLARPDLPVVLNAAGLHNVCNALAAICVACELGVPDAAIQKALLEFKGVGRRFQHYGQLQYQGKHFDLIDDYGHHPVEMQATIAAARGAYPGRRLLLAFQPHRYTRTRDCFEDFVRVLGTVDALALAEVYSAGEAPIVGADGRALARSVRLAEKVEPRFVPEIGEMPQAILDVLVDGDVVMCMGAGSIGLVPAQVKKLTQEAAV